MRPAKQFANIEEYQHIAKGEMSADYLYLYENGKWSVYGLYHEPDWVRVEVRKDVEIL